MARATALINNFTAGEISPYLYSRADIQPYYRAAKTIKNFIILPYGGLLRRPGTVYVAEVKDSSKKVRLIPFEYNVEQSYILEFGDQYIRFYMNNGQIQSGGSPYEISSPYTEDELFELQFAQNADVMWICHPNHKPKKLSRYGHTSWSLDDYTPTSDPFTHDSWAASTAYSLDDYIVPTSPNGYYYRCVTAGTSGASEPTWPTTIGQTVNDGSITWRCEYDNPVNYPSAVTFHEQRLWFGYTRANPQTLWATKSGDFEDMTTGTADDDALSYTLGTNQVNAIRWLSSGKVLAIGTSGGVLIAGSNDATTPITPTNIMIHTETNVGCYPYMPQRLETNVAYIQRDQERLREFAYHFDSDSYIATDISLLAEHLTANKIVDMAYQPSPYSILWCVLDNGEIATLTRNVAQNVFGWAQQTTDGVFESVASIPRGDGDYDEVWFVVKRTINGQTKRYIEYLPSYDFATQEDAFYVDCGLTYDGTATTTISGLDHLEGETVSVLADGAVEPEKTVSSGQITLSVAAEKVQVGIGFDSELVLLRPEIGSMLGTSQGKIQRVNKVAVNLYRSLGGQIGYETQMDTMYFRSTSDNMDEPPPLFSGYKYIHFPKGYDDNLEVRVLQEQPLPMCIRAVVLFMETFDQ